MVRRMRPGRNIVWSSAMQYSKVRGVYERNLKEADKGGREGEEGEQLNWWR